MKLGVDEVGDINKDHIVRDSITTEDRTCLLWDNAFIPCKDWSLIYSYWLNKMHPGRERSFFLEPE